MAMLRSFKISTGFFCEFFFFLTNYAYFEREKITLKSCALVKFELKWSLVVPFSNLCTTPHPASKMAGIIISRNFIKWQKKKESTEIFLNDI
jgi:hypothetical protein